jgi:hypothetical protein
VKDITTTIIGVIALFAFGYFLFFLTRQISAEQQQWDRLVYIYGGVEAVAFAAAGYFFGNKVNRERSEKAEKKAATVEEAARKDHGKTVVAEAKFSSLVKYIDANAPSSPIYSSVLDGLHNLVQQPEIGDKEPILTRVIKEKYKTAATVPDERWNALSRFAKSL